MSGLFGPSEDDLERLRSTVHSLGTTSVPGLAAALAWRERKAERLLAHELARPGSPLSYDPGRRVVKWAVVPAAPTAPTAVPATAPSLPTGRGPPALAPTIVGSTFKTLCPSCHVALIATGSASLAVCPQCGRLSSTRTGASGATSTAAALPTSPPPVAKTAAPPAESSRPPLPDRRAQEMFAAYVTSRPIPCPKCRTPLHHRGVSEYACPSCGEIVRFPSTSGGPVPPVVAVPAR